MPDDDFNSGYHSNMPSHRFTQGSWGWQGAQLREQQERDNNSGASGGDGAGIGTLIGFGLIGLIGFFIVSALNTPNVKLGSYRVSGCYFSGQKKENSRMLAANEWVKVAEISDKDTLKISAYKKPDDGTSRLGTIPVSCLRKDTYSSS